MTREKHLLGHLIFQTNEGDVAVASRQMVGTSLDRFIYQKVIQRMTIENWK
jgi:hypothetical protein